MVMVNFDIYLEQILHRGPWVLTVFRTMNITKLMMYLARSRNSLLSRS